MDQRGIMLGVATISAGVAAWYLLSSRGAKKKFDVRKMRRKLNTHALGREFEFRDTVTSTMTVADEIVKARGGTAAHGFVIAADEQTAGIGRRNRDWKSVAGEGNIYMSFVWHVSALQVSARVETMIQLNFACGVAVATAARLCCGVEAMVKWPNDVYVGERKVSGALVNFDGLETGVAGIGVNVNQSAESLARMGMDKKNVATSLSIESGREESREEIIAVICNEVERLMSRPFAETLDEYAAMSMLNGRVVRVCHKARDVPSDEDYDALVLGFFPNGNLKVSRVGEPGSEISLSGEEISIKPL